MITRAVAQPATQLGAEVGELLKRKEPFSRIIFVSAFVQLRTILRLRDPLLAQTDTGASLRLVVGIDLAGTSREVVEELLRWDCETFLFHNTLARATFHPKLYLFETNSSATLFVGSNNLTDGGFYSNYEATTRCDFSFPEDADQYERIMVPLLPFLNPSGVTVQRLDPLLLATLVARGELLSERDARKNRREGVRDRNMGGTTAVPPSPFGPSATPLPPLPRRDVRSEERREPEVAGVTEQPPRTPARLPTGVLVWRKELPATDALRPAEGHHVGGVRLTQARFRDSAKQLIDQTTYFRQLFDDFDWEPEPSHHSDQEHTFVPMRVTIRGKSHGIHNFEISHKPSGEAGQSNYTTILRWGREFTPTIIKENLTGTTLSLYETSDEEAPFSIEINDA